MQTSFKSKQYRNKDKKALIKPAWKNLNNSGKCVSKSVNFNNKYTNTNWIKIGNLLSSRVASVNDCIFLKLDADPMKLTLIKNIYQINF